MEDVPTDPEAIAKLPVTVEIASEYRYRESVPDADTLVVVISQSGETADTLAALKHAKALGMERTLAICNVPGSSLVRESDLTLMTQAGPEIGVASTKAFTTQLVALMLLALALGRVRGANGEHAPIVQGLRELPGVINQVLQPWVGAVLAKVIVLIGVILFIQKRPQGLFAPKGRTS